MPRQATEAEINEMADLMIKHTGCPDVEIQPDRTTVIEDYISDCPGYAGDVIIVLWGLPHYASFFIRQPNGQLMLRAVTTDESACHTVL